MQNHDHTNCAVTCISHLVHSSWTSPSWEQMNSEKNGSEMERCHIHRVSIWVHGRNIEEELNASIFQVFVQDLLAFSPVLPWEVGALGKDKRKKRKKNKNAQFPRNLNKLNANFAQVRDRCPKHLTRTTVAWRYNFHYALFINSCQCSPASSTPFIPARIVCLVHARAQKLFSRIHSTRHAQRHHSFKIELHIQLSIVVNTHLFLER